MDELKNQLLITLGLNTSINLYPFFFDIALSPVPISGEWAVMFNAFAPTITTCVTATYGGYQTPTTSVPGTQIEEPPPPPPVMPPPPEPPILRECRQRITEPIKKMADESGYLVNQLSGQVTGQIDYQLAQVEPALDKITNKINANIINTMERFIKELILSDWAYHQPSK
jgi:hypothetical protein